MFTTSRESVKKVWFWQLDPYQDQESAYHRLCRINYDPSFENLSLTSPQMYSIGTLWSYIENKRKIQYVKINCHQNALCASLRSNKRVECISLIIKHLQT